MCTLVILRHIHPAIVALAPGRLAHDLASDAASCQAPYQDVTPLRAPRRSLDNLREK